jgi:hypothetical protein
VCELVADEDVVDHIGRRPHRSPRRPSGRPERPMPLCVGEQERRRGSVSFYVWAVA